MMKGKKEKKSTKVAKALEPKPEVVTEITPEPTAVAAELKPVPVRYVAGNAWESRHRNEGRA
jgi:hypothetical protein